uniref:Uncharacterized protein n=1 Tax=viral metagenome TaxID=1070528 RepID=A0A6C0AT04_9ZZZZ
MATRTLRHRFASWTPRVAACPERWGDARVECCVTGESVLQNNAVWLSCGRHAVTGDAAWRWAESCHERGVQFTCPACRVPDGAVGRLLRMARRHAGHDARIAEVVGYGGLGSADHRQAPPRPLYHTVTTMVLLLLMLGTRASAATRRAVVDVMHRMRPHMPVGSKFWYATVLSAAEACVPDTLPARRAALLLRLTCWTLAKSGFICAVLKALRVWQPVHAQFVRGVARHAVLRSTCARITRVLRNDVESGHCDAAQAVRTLRWFAALAWEQPAQCRVEDVRRVHAALSAPSQPPCTHNAGAVDAAWGLVRALCAAPRVPGARGRHGAYELQNAARFARAMTTQPAAAVEVFFNRVSRAGAPSRHGAVRSAPKPGPASAPSQPQPPPLPRA